MAERGGSAAVGVRIRIARAARGWSQRELAQRTGFDATAVSHWERGERLPSIESLRELSRALGVTADWLLGLDES